MSNNNNSSTPTSNNNEETTAVARIDDAAVAHRLRLTEQLVSVFGFAPSVVEHAMEALPDNTNMTVETLTQYILEHDLAKDPGGPITPRDVCEHLQNGALLSASVWNASHLCAPCSGPPVEEEDSKLPDAIRIGEEDGMQDFTMSLKGLIDDELIDRPTAFAVAPNKDALKMALKGIDVKAPGIL